MVVTLLKCNACKKWSAKEFKDLRTYTFKCFLCGNKERVKNKGNPFLNLELKQVGSGLEASRVVSELNSKIA